MSLNYPLDREKSPKNYKMIFKPDLELTHSMIQKREAGVWQRRFWEHTLKSQKDYGNHINYLHYNPVEHGLVKHVRDWPWSTFHQYVDQGIYPLDWGVDD